MIYVVVVAAVLKLEDTSRCPLRRWDFRGIIHLNLQTRTPPPLLHRHLPQFVNPLLPSDSKIAERASHGGAQICF